MIYINMEGPIKCHNCRSILLEDVQTQILNKSNCDPQLCNTFNGKQFIFVLEEHLPNWIKAKIEEEQWTKGKLHCASCGSKVGSFDYVSGRKCSCGNSVIPSVHLISSQIDKPLKVTIHSGT